LPRENKHSNTLDIVMLRVTNKPSMLSGIMLNVVMSSVITLNVTI